MVAAVVLGWWYQNLMLGRHGGEQSNTFATESDIKHTGHSREEEFRINKIVGITPRV
jgi:hypothetical protein